MMAVKHISGNTFNSKCQTIVNTVNCVGVMGKGIALAYRLRYPKMYEEYKVHCKNKLIKIGSLWLYKKQKNAPWILSFPTKVHWKDQSRIEWIEQGLKKFAATYETKEISSIAFPLLGTHNGGLDKNEVRNLMDHYLSECDIDIEIYDYDPNAIDELFTFFKSRWLALDEKEIEKETGIKPQYASRISEIIQNGEIKSIIGLANFIGIGEKTLEKAFGFVLNTNIGN